MNARRGHNREPPAIAQVTRRSPQQAPQARPVGIGQGKRGSQEYLASTVERAAPRGKFRHQYSWVLFLSLRLLRPGYFGPSSRISSMTAGPMVTKMMEGR